MPERKNYFSWLSEYVLIQPRESKETLNHVICLGERTNAESSLQSLWDYLPLPEQCIVLLKGVLIWLFYAGSTLIWSHFRPFMQPGNACYKSTRMRWTITDGQIWQLPFTTKQQKDFVSFKILPCHSLLKCPSPRT